MLLCCEVIVFDCVVLCVEVVVYFGFDVECFVLFVFGGLLGVQ